METTPIPPKQTFDLPDDLAQALVKQHLLETILGEQQDEETDARRALQEAQARFNKAVEDVERTLGEQRKHDERVETLWENFRSDVDRSVFAWLADNVPYPGRESWGEQE